MSTVVTSRQTDKLLPKTLKLVKQRMQVLVGGIVHIRVNLGTMMREFGDHLDLTADNTTLRNDFQHFWRGVRDMRN